MIRRQTDHLRRMKPCRTTTTIFQIPRRRKPYPPKKEEPKSEPAPEAAPEEASSAEEDSAPAEEAPAPVEAEVAAPVSEMKARDTEVNELAGLGGIISMDDSEVDQSELDQFEGLFDPGGIGQTGRRISGNRGRPAGRRDWAHRDQRRIDGRHQLLLLREYPDLQGRGQTRSRTAVGQEDGMLKNQYGELMGMIYTPLNARVTMTQLQWKETKEEFLSRVDKGGADMRGAFTEGYPESVAQAERKRKGGLPRLPGPPHSGER